MRLGAWMEGEHCYADEHLITQIGQFCMWISEESLVLEFYDHPDEFEAKTFE